MESLETEAVQQTEMSFLSSSHHGSELSSQTVMIEYVNSSYIMYDSSDNDRIKKDYRIVAEAIGTKPGSPCDITGCGPPFILLPEQAMLLKEFGYARIVRLKKTLPDNFCSVSKQIPLRSTDCDDGVQASTEMATKIAKGRKIKALKRMAKQFANAAELRVHEADFEGVEVTTEEINAVMSEMTAVSKTALNNFELITLPLRSDAEDAYEDVDVIPMTIGFRLRFAVFRDLWKRGFYMTDGLRFGCDYLLYEDVPGEGHAKYMVKCVSTMASICPLDLAALSRVGSQVKKDTLLAIVSPDSFVPYYIVMSWWRN